MSLVGALLFCNDCGGLLERCPASQANIDCDVCGKRNQNTKEKAERAKMPSTHVPKIPNEPGERSKNRHSPNQTPQITHKWPTSITTESAPTAFPSRLRDARSEIQVLSAEDRETWAMTTTACPQCANPEMRFRDVQLRGADEGSTVFYRCPKCDYK
ncbi:hypothetical protein D6C87_05489 [Aureobasidium pullulans]|uniref:DNA-directed RNA polymerase subunit n=1 Tax=Aureobasidium pullulans TaxID=5580 RepID=A0AB38M9L1_AURPU|nr:hypothetical protein D6C94_00922 [Aureobasidium pullulans]THZ41761.1 hypothetical protein D6C87_05489 [Aureobasidium pullulans]